MISDCLESLFRVVDTTGCWGCGQVVLTSFLATLGFSRGSTVQMAECTLLDMALVPHPPAPISLREPERLAHETNMSLLVGHCGSIRLEEQTTLADMHEP